MKLNKKGVSDVVTTVLMILLVIAAIGILWVVIQRFVTQGTGTVPNQADCLTLQLTPSNARFVAGGTGTPANTLNVSVTRGGTSTANPTAVFFVDGSIVSSMNGTVPSIGEVKVFGVSGLTSPAIANGSRVKVAAKIGDTTCNPSEEITITVS